MALVTVLRIPWGERGSLTFHRRNSRLRLLGTGCRWELGGPFCGYPKSLQYVTLFPVAGAQEVKTVKVTSSFFRFGELPKKKKKKNKRRPKDDGEELDDAWTPSSLSDEGQTQGQS